MGTASCLLLEGKVLWALGAVDLADLGIGVCVCVHWHQTRWASDEGVGGIGAELAGSADDDAGALLAKIRSVS